jgi:hypothetical protein
VVVVDLLLDYVQQHRAADTYRWHKDRLDEFCNFIDPGAFAPHLKPLHVQQWIDSRPNLASGSIRARQLMDRGRLRGHGSGNSDPR